MVFRLGAGGQFEGVRLEVSSGDARFDDKAVRAVNAVAYSPPPANWTEGPWITAVFAVR